MRDNLRVMLRFIVRGMLAFDKRVLKRLLSVETPLYRRWWKLHSLSMQRKLDKIHSLKFDF